MEIQSIASVAPIVDDASAAKAFYVEALGLSFETEVGDYRFTERLPGAKHFGVWPLSEAAQACFGTPAWPTGTPIPQASIEFELAKEADVAAAADELERAGYRLLHGARTEPWKQVIARLLTAEGLLVGVCYTPWQH